jgi:hypothetical protein
MSRSWSNSIPGTATDPAQFALAIDPLPPEIAVRLSFAGMR